MIGSLLNRLSRAARSGAVYFAMAGTAFAQGAPTTDEINASNNPLNPQITVNVQNYFIPSIHGVPNRNANQFWMRGLVPMEFGGMPQLMRFSLPVTSDPRLLGGDSTGLGDLTIFNIPVLQQKPIAFGIGPLLVAPTASDRMYGAGKWQLGAAAAFAAPQSWGLFGALATYQASVAGNKYRDDVSILTVQPFLFYNLPNGFYLQSSGAWSFDFERDVHYIPVGLGIGRHWKVTKDISMNAFIEPQYVAVSQGRGTPRWLIFAGINFNYSLEEIIQKRHRAAVASR